MKPSGNREETEENIDETNQSEFNSGIATLQRLDEIKKWLLFATTKNDSSMLFFHLKAFFKELYPIFNKEKKGKEKSERNQQETAYTSCLNAINDYKKNREDANKLNDAMQKLEAWEFLLRDSEQQHGLNMRLKADGRFALGR